MKFNVNEIKCKRKTKCYNNFNNFLYITLIYIDYFMAFSSVFNFQISDTLVRSTLIIDVYCFHERTLRT